MVSTDNTYAYNAIICLGSIGGNQAVDILEKELYKKNNDNARESIYSLGRIANEKARRVLLNRFRLDNIGNDELNSIALNLGYARATEAVPEILNKLKHVKHIKSESYYGLFFALGDIRDEGALEYLRKVFQEGDYDALYALSKFRDKKSSRMILKEMINGERKANYVGYKYVECANALGEIGDNSVVPELIDNLFNSNRLAGLCAIALMTLEGKEIDENLIKAYEMGNKMAIFALAYRNGGKYLKMLPYYTMRDWDEVGTPPYFLEKTIRFKWGEKKGIIKVFKMFLDGGGFERFIEKIIKQLPDNFPDYDIYATRYSKWDEYEKVKKWVRKNYKEMYWDERKKRYFIKQ